MRRTFLFVMTMLAGMVVNAQITEGQIVYDQKTNLHKGLPDMLKPRVPEFKIDRFTLSFKDSVSLFSAIPADAAPDPFENNNRAMTAGSGNENLQLYKNHARELCVEQRELDGKPYLIRDVFSTLRWKLTDETKTIKGYLCRKAIATDTLPATSGWTFRSSGRDSVKKNVAVPVEAWFSELIKVPAGPMNYDRLPGVVLEVNVDSGTIVYQAQEIRKKQVGEIKEPVKGKVVTKEGFSRIRKELGGKRMTM